MRRIIPIEPEGYERHSIHRGETIWAETNCYVDVLVELIHALGFDPVAALPFTLTADFEADQWTFFKYQPGDLLDLYGMEIQELQLWRGLMEHVEAQVAEGRPVLVELDSFYLPDTAGTAYRQEHEKTTVAVNMICPQQRRMGYFHGQGYYALDGEDFERVWQLHLDPEDRPLPPYAELVKLHRDRGEEPSDGLFQASRNALIRQLTCMPKQNPFELFRSRFAADLDWLIQEPLDTFHKYSFATLRQFGACFELGTTYLRWLSDHGELGLDPAIEAYEGISTSAKTFQFHLARSMVRKKPLDLSPVDAMGELWDRGSSALLHHFGLQ